MPTRARSSRKAAGLAGGATGALFGIGERIEIHRGEFEVDIDAACAEETA